MPEGRIGVERGPGQGSRFQFSARFPVSTPPPAPAAARCPSQRSGTILVAEDIALNRMIVQSMLEGAGHSVTLVADGTEAVEAVGLGRLDLGHNDVHMPGGHGLAATA